MDSACIFCKIIARDVPAGIVFEDDHMCAFLDVGPLADGHLLTVPRTHYELITDMPDSECAALTSKLPMLGKALMAVTGAAGFNILQNNGQEAGQVVKHVHFHLIPRVGGDGLGYRWNAGSYAAGRADALAAAYNKALADQPR